MEKAWWKESVIYQIYPRSFYDSNGDGIGDLQGIIQKLDYLKELGVDVVWLNPVYESPNDDMGYDIADYQKIMQEFGTMGDWEELLSEMHKRGIKLIMDLVVNHTSDEHPWFIASKSSKDNPYRDYYIWKEGKGTKEPTNWQSYFSVPAWHQTEETDDYYLHYFTIKQPDLNWSNPQVRQEVFDMMKWWLDKGIDGFRMDVINMIGKPETFEEGKVNIDESGYSFNIDAYTNQPIAHTYLKEMYEQVLSKYDIMTVGETPNVTPADASLYVDPSRKELNMVFQFEIMQVDEGRDFYHKKPFKLSDFKHIWTKWQLDLEGKGWNSIYLSNHDFNRHLSRFGSDTTYRVESAKMLATMIHTLKGTPYIYQGEEIGMTNCKWEGPNEWRDVRAFNYHETMKGFMPEEEILTCISNQTRDNARTPMQWDTSNHAGFTIGTPWIKVNPNYTTICVQKDQQSPDSIFKYYQKLIKLRKQNPVMVYGSYEPLVEEHEQLFVYKRVLEDTTWLIVLNFSEQTVEQSVMGIEENLTLLLSNYTDESTVIRPYEARIYSMK